MCLVNNLITSKKVRPGSSTAKFVHAKPPAQQPGCEVSICKMSLVCIKSRRALVGNSQRCKRSTILLEGIENQNPESYLRLFCYFLQTLVGLIVHTFEILY